MRWLLPLLLVTAGAAAWLLTAEAARGLPDVELDDTRPRPQGGFYRGSYAEPRTFNPFTAVDVVATRVVLAWTHDALMDRDPETGALRPALAESYTESDGGTTITFAVREGLRFSDGAPVTAADVQFTARVAQQPALAGGPIAAALRDVASVEVESDDVATGDVATGDVASGDVASGDAAPRRVVVRLRERTFTTLPRVATGLRIVQREWCESAVRALGVRATPESDAAAFADALARVRHPGPGTGPFRIAELADGEPWWRRGRDLVLVQNPHCWRRAAQPECWNLAGCVLRFDVGPEARMAALRAQEIDWLAGETDLGRALREDAALREHYRRFVYDPIGLGAYFVLWNLRDQALADPRVRRALGMLFDREAIASALLGGLARPAAGWFHPKAPEYPQDLRPLSFDPARARALLADAGYGPERPLELEILVASERDLQRRIVELASPAFREAGVQLRSQVLEFAGVIARLDEHRYDGTIVLKFHEPEVDPFDFFHSSTAWARRTGLADPAADSLLERARAELDPARRLELFYEFNRWMEREQPVTLLVHPRAQVLLHRRFRGVEVGAFGLSPERWWVLPKERIAPR